MRIDSSDVSELLSYEKPNPNSTIGQQTNKSSSAIKYSKGICRISKLACSINKLLVIAEKTNILMRREKDKHDFFISLI